ncbi:acylphosphatase [Gimibacter soli]|uniref:acylphosphatase n=1 Tax=Gimibacter soli TaxID=3024400 RepID=A0AAE9XSV9_9PROT|nr:acylphosphatase [Gimibacter soli]WCL55669.1 acylphosphatase [Gimibacter soli]
MNERTAIKVRIHGKVQGVWYRGWTEGEANRLGLHGWVRNRIDGTVEALFVGDGPQVEAMLALCREGPPAAKVEKLVTEPARGITPARFDVKPTV